MAIDFPALYGDGLLAEIQASDTALGPDHRRLNGAEADRRILLQKLADAYRELDTALAENERRNEPTDWGEPEVQWTWGVRRPDETAGPDLATPNTDEDQVRECVAAVQDTNGYRKALLRRDVGAWREVPQAGAKSEKP